MEPLSRRNFIHIAAGTAVLGLASSDAGAQRSAGFPGSLCFFSKHLPRMNGRELGRSLEALGFDGVDLTVRPGGHVDPKRVAVDLPVLVDAIRHEGLTVPMITTELLSDADPVAQPTLETAARLKIPFYKAGYYRYKFVDVRKELEAAGAQLRGLADLSRRHGMRVLSTRRCNMRLVMVRLAPAPTSNSGRRATRICAAAFRIAFSSAAGRRIFSRG
jgi:hypothetical protein